MYEPHVQSSYELHVQSFTTPRGRPVSLWVREDTSDWNTCQSALTEDEYGLRNLQLAGQALDIGAHIGSVTVALAVDNPELQVTAVEPVPPNVAVLRMNLELNDLAGRVTVIEGAACGPRRKHQAITFGYRGSELAEHHAFIGNSTLPPVGLERETTQALCHPLREFLPLDFMKIDAEGAEWDFLQGPALAEVPLMRGEWHPTEGRTQSDFLGLLEATHQVTFSGPVGGPGGFEAVRR